MFSEIVGCSESVSMGIVPATPPTPAPSQLLKVVADVQHYRVATEVEG